MATVTGLTADATAALVETAKSRANHTGSQTSSTISDLAEVVQDLMASTIVAGTNVTKTYDDTAGTLTLSSSASGGSSTTEGVLLSAYGNGTGTAAANTTAVQNWISAARTAKKPAINDLGAISVNISTKINMIGDDLVVRGNGLNLVQTDNTQGGIIVGAQGQKIDNLRITYSNNPTSANTAANAIEFSNCLYSRFSNLVTENAGRGLYMIQTNPTNNDTNTNTVFSCVFDNIRVNSFAISGISMYSWPSGGASSTGNVWLNTYVHDNWFGSNGTPSGYCVTFKDWDESVFDQLNVEWTNPSGDAVFIQACRNFVFNSVHFEGIQLTGNSALFRAYYNFRVIIHSLFAKSTVIANNTGQKSIFRSYTADGNPGSLDVTNLRVDSTTNAGAKPFGIIEVESGTTGADYTFRKVDTGFATGALVVDPTGVVPSQVEGYNDVRLRNFTAPNLPVDLIRTTDHAAVTTTTLVADDIMQFTAGVGTYLVEGELYYICPAAADLKYRFNHAGTATGKFTTYSVNTAATTSDQAQSGNWKATQLNTDTIAGGVDAIEVGLAFAGTLVVTASGLFSVQYAENTASGSLIVKTASRLTYRKKT